MTTNLIVRWMMEVAIVGGNGSNVNGDCGDSCGGGCERKKCLRVFSRISKVYLQRFMEYAG